MALFSSFLEYRVVSIFSLSISNPAHTHTITDSFVENNGCHKFLSIPNSSKDLALGFTMLRSNWKLPKNKIKWDFTNNPK